MLIQVVGLALLGFLVGLILYFFGFIGWIVLQLLKKGLNLKIIFKTEEKEN